MARRLADAGVQTTLIADSAVFAMMARVNKVLVGAHAVLANGGVVAPAGAHVVALAARRHSVPLVVLVGLHKLSPLFPHDPDVTFNGAGRARRGEGGGGGGGANGVRARARALLAAAAAGGVVWMR